MARVIRELRTRTVRPRLRPVTAVTIALVAYVMFLYYFQILSEPLFRWDARSVWFFHAKMIWTTGALRQSDGWNHPSVDFASPDYPNLVPALAAQLASLVGHWNEFMPKGSLLLMLTPLVLWVFSIRRVTFAFALLLALYFFSLHAWLWNGYMDAYLAMYSGVALLALGRFAEEGRDTDLYCGICALGIASATKNEGLLFATCVAIGVLLLGMRRPPLAATSLLRKLRDDRGLIVILLISAAPVLLWAALKNVWGLQSHVMVPGLVERVWDRLSDGGTAMYLMRFLVTRATVAWVLVAVIVIAAWFVRHERRRVHAGALLAAIVTTVYFCGMYAVYFIAPANVSWLLLTSATRVMATVSFGLLITISFLLISLERRDAVARPTGADPAAAPTVAREAR
jgi:hypothetical protein